MGRVGVRRRVGGVLLVAVLVGVAGCSTGGDEGDEADTTTTFVVETPDGTQAFSSDEEAGSFSFESDDGKGTLTFDLDGDGLIAEGGDGAFELSPGAPAGWPTDFPVPEGAEVVGGNVVEAAPLRQLTTVYRVPLAGSDVVAFYEAELADWLPLADVADDQDATYRASVSFEGEQVGFVSVAVVDGATELAVQLVIEDE